jgi:diacylglycerol O-acyltransferase / wax synthase
VLQHQPFFNIIVTNVPGPSIPLYALGARMVEAFPVVPLVGNQGIGVAALSYLDEMNLGILSDPSICPDVDPFCEGVRAAFADLRAVGHDGIERPPKSGDRDDAEAARTRPE